MFGQAVTFTATVTISAGPTPVDASGTVTFSDGTTALAANVALDGSGEATFTTSTLAVGTHTITATYNGATGLRHQQQLRSTQTVDGVADAGGPYTIDEGGDLALDGYGVARRCRRDVLVGRQRRRHVRRRHRRHADADMGAAGGAGDHRRHPS